ncbi:hypothetical protein DFH08DRAFT_298202 [Mycena albidolilacea]|uniref:Uncharacterized protein n=1 Tax=Mycena albidolilacea TaxID=1033008 RepID=A0AAD6ZQA3_9AGAR|nr:hypothetical protein DFH08DRAFT_298202 [Mycena albidolilacea]
MATYLSAYPSFILSGLLSPPSSSPSSLHSRDSFDFAPRRGSLPTDSPPSYYSSADEGSMFYFTLQQRRDKDEYRSFLSLDLAESLSLRTLSTRRRRSTKYQSREPPFAVDFQIPDSPSLLPPASPIGLRSSPASSLRALPSPKPAPVSSLPSVPSPRSKSPDAVPTSLAVQALPRRKASVASHATRASATTSTVSTRYRRTRRSKALACLEGRRPIVSTGNFMSLSEDEDDEGEDDEFSLLSSQQEQDQLSLDHLSLTNDQLIMLIARLEDGDLRSAPSPPRSKSSSRGSSTRTRASPVAPSSPRRRNKATLGLKSFMDFHNDDQDKSRWSWRSFVEVAT